MDFLVPFFIVGAIIAAVVVGFGIRLVALLSREGSGGGTTDPRPRRTAATDVALGLACFAYLVMLLPLYGSGPPDPNHFDPNTHGIEDAIGQVLKAVEVLSMLLLWAALAILLFRGGVSGGMRVVAGVLLPLSGIAAIFAGVLRSRYGGWSIVVPLSLPPLIALYAMWMRQPARHAALPAKIVNPIAWGAILVLTIAPIPLSTIDARIYAARGQQLQAEQEAQMARRRLEDAQEREGEIARFQALTADSSLGDYLDDLYFPVPYAAGETHHEAALTKARQVKSRQTDTVMLLKQGRIERLEELWNLDIEATPAVCAAYGDALHQEMAKIDLDTTNGQETVERQLPNIKWLVGTHCDLDAALGFVETQFREYCGRHQCRTSDIADRPVLTFLDTLGALRQPH